MVRLEILSGKYEGHSWLAPALPFMVGRSPSADLQLDDPGIWDEHFRVSLAEDRSFVLSTDPRAPVIIDGESVQEAVLRNGQVIEAGLVKLRFGLAPGTQRGQRARELAVWVSLLLLAALQVALILWLPR